MRRFDRPPTEEPVKGPVDHPDAEANFEGMVGEKVNDVEQFTGDLYDDRQLFAGLLVLAILMIFTQKVQLVTMYLSFCLACYSAITNDSIQVIGTQIAATKDMAWYWVFLVFAVTANVTTYLSWSMQDGDLSWQRLAAKGFDYDPVEYSYWQAIAPVVLMIITRLRMPVSTSFLLLGLFADKSSTFFKVIYKSMQGQVVSFACTILIYPIFQHGPIRKMLQGDDKNPFTFGFETLASAFLWSTWLQQDMSNIAVQLHRKTDLAELLLTMFCITFCLLMLSLNRGEKVQTIIDQKFNTSNLNECTVIDIVQGLILLQFKQLNKLPMSTTWTFLGCINGRELGITIAMCKWSHLPLALKMLFKELFMAFLGLGVSILMLVLQKPDYFE